MLLGLRRAPKMSLSVIHTFVTTQPLPQEAVLGMRLIIIVSLCYLSVDSRNKTDLELSVHREFEISRRLRQREPQKW